MSKKVKSFASLFLALALLLSVTSMGATAERENSTLITN